MFCMLKKKKYILIAFQNIIKIVKKFILLMISNREAKKVAVKKLSVLLKRITSKYHGYFFCLNCLHFLQ